MTAPIETAVEETIEVEPLEVGAATEAEAAQSADVLTEADREAQDTSRRIEELTEQLSGNEQLLADREGKLSDLQREFDRVMVSIDTGLPAHLLIGESRENMEDFAHQLLDWYEERKKGEEPPREYRKGPLKSGYTRTDELFPVSAKEQAVNALRNVAALDPLPRDYSQYAIKGK